MTDLFLFGLGLALLLVMDLVTYATSTGFLHASFARLISQTEQPEKRLQRTIALTRGSTRLQASLELAQRVFRLLLVGSVLLFTIQRPLTNPVLVTVGVLLLVTLVVFLAEWFVRLVVLEDAEAWAFRLAPYAQVLVLIFSPIVSLLMVLSPGDEGTLQDAGDIMVDELKTLVDAGQQEGVFEQEERQMIHSIFDLGDTLAREIMVPRIDMLALDVNSSLPDAVDAFLNSGYTRLPVYEDTVDNVLGLLYAKDLLRVWREGNHIGSLRDMLRPAYFIPEAKKVDELLAEMQSQRIHMAVVFDEYGGVAGLVTLEDIMEEIFGEIQDEYDLGEESPYQELANGEYIFLGRVDLDDFNEVLGSNLPKDEADTIGGFIYSRLGRVPTSGEGVQVDNLLLTVEQVSGRRISKVRARWPQTLLKDKEQVADVDG